MEFRSASLRDGFFNFTAAGNVLLRLGEESRAIVEYEEYLKLAPKGAFASQTLELVRKLKKRRLNKGRRVHLIRMYSELTIRRALPEDANALTDIVNAAQRYWGYPEAWIDLLRSDLNISPEFIRSKEIYLAEESTQPLGFYVRVNNELEELWIAPAHFGTGVGKELFLHAKERAARH